MKPATILRVHSIISSALDLAVRYDWADRNVAKNASPHPRKREPDPPSPDQAARLLASLRSWLHRIAVNGCLNALRDRSRRPREVPLMPELPQPTRMADPGLGRPLPRRAARRPARRRARAGGPLRHQGGR
jgi:hypothetical protein